jgi:hypothetical protein
MIQTADLLRVFHAHRGDAIVVPVQAGVRLAGLLNSIFARSGPSIPDR